MFISSPAAFRAAAFSGFLGVALGAFGAHGLSAVLALHPKAAQWWETAVFYQMVHTIVMLLLACLQPFPRWAWRLFGAGILIFSGCLYLMAVTRVLWLGAVVPVGGLCLLGGWLTLAITIAGRSESPQCNG